MANVSSSDWTRTCASRGDPSSARIGVADRWSQRSVAGLDVEAERVEAVGDDKQAVRVPVERARLVVDERGKPGRPGAARSLEPQLGATQRLRVRRRPATPRSTRLPPTSDRAKTAGARSAAAPSPARAQAARVGDRAVAGFRRHRRQAGQERAWFAVASADVRSSSAAGVRRPRLASRSAAGRTSVIGATVALARMRSVPGRDGEDRGREPGRGPDHGVAPEVRIHDHPDRPGMADRRDPADREPGELVGLARRRPANVAFAGHRRQAGQVDPVGPGDEAQERLRAVARRGPRTRATSRSGRARHPARSRPPRRCGSTPSNWVTSSVTPLRSAASRTRWIAGWAGSSGTAGV